MPIRSRTGFSSGSGDYVNMGELELLLRLFFPGFYSKLQQEGMGRAQQMSKFESEQELAAEKALSGQRTEEAKQLYTHQARTKEEEETKKSQKFGGLLTKLKERSNMQLINPPPLSQEEEGLYAQNLPEIQKTLAARLQPVSEFSRMAEEANRRGEQEANTELLTKKAGAARAQYMPVGQGTVLRLNPDTGAPMTGFTGESNKVIDEPVMTKSQDKEGRVIELPTGQRRSTLTTTPGHAFDPFSGGGYDEVGQIDMNSASRNAGSNNTPNGESPSLAFLTPDLSGLPRNLTPQATTGEHEQVAPQNSMGTLNTLLTKGAKFLGGHFVKPPPVVNNPPPGQLLTKPDITKPDYEGLTNQLDLQEFLRLGIKPRPKRNWNMMQPGY